jgi:hypothetical protein
VQVDIPRRQTPSWSIWDFRWLRRKVKLSSVNRGGGLPVCMTCSPVSSLTLAWSSIVALWPSESLHDHKDHQASHPSRSLSTHVPHFLPQVFEIAGHMYLVEQGPDEGADEWPDEGIHYRLFSPPCKRNCRNGVSTPHTLK